MSDRERFEAWFRTTGPFADSTCIKKDAWLGFRAGANDMAERCAEMAMEHAPTDYHFAILANRIRSLAKDGET